MVRLTDRPDMTLDVYHGRKTTIQQQPPSELRTMTHLLCVVQTSQSFGQPCVAIVQISPVHWAYFPEKDNCVVRVI